MPSPIHLLLVEDNPIEARLTQKWLDVANGGPFEVEWVEHVAKGVDRLTRPGIDMVLSDLNLADCRGLETFYRLHAQAPNVPIVVLTGQDDDAIGAQAVETGAQDYLVKQQLDVTKLARMLQLTLARHRAHESQRNKSPLEKTPRMIGFLGAKGGVGTTTVAVNVATAIAKQKNSVILAEIRPNFGTLGYLLRQEPQVRNLQTLLARSHNGFDMDNVVAHLCKGPSGLRILFGPQALDAFEEIDSHQAEALVKVLGQMAEFVILDLAAQPSPAIQAVVGQCQTVVVVVERELGAVLCAQAVLRQLNLWGVDADSICAVVVNRNEYLKPLEIEEIKSRLGCEIVGVVPLASSADLETAISRAQDVANSFSDLAKQFAISRLVGVKV